MITENEAQKSLQVAMGRVLSLSSLGLISGSPLSFHHLLIALAWAGAGLLVCVFYGNWHCRASQRRQIDDL